MTRTEGELFELPPGARRGGGAKGSGDAAADDAALEARLVPLVRTRTGRTVEVEAFGAQRGYKLVEYEDSARPNVMKRRFSVAIGPFDQRSGR